MLYLQYGSPTIELFVASYNNRANHSNAIPIEVGDYGYIDYKTDFPFQFGENHGIYSKNDSHEWWIASPGYRYGAKSQIYVSYNSSCRYFSSSYVDYNAEWVHPVVCMHTSVFNSKYTLVDE